MIKRVPPKPGQESVWDYPRPPRVEENTKLLRVVFNGVTIAESTSGYRVLETSHPPSYYIPQADVLMEHLTATTRGTFCEFKGKASYWTVTIDERKAVNAIWGYKTPARGFEVIKDHLCFYANHMDECFVGDEKVQPQEGDFYGGWITSNIVGPFKGGAGTWGW